MRYPIADLFHMMPGTDDDKRRHLAISGGAYGAMRLHGLTLDQAERYAERAGLHPYEVWPLMRDDVIAATCEPPPVRVVHALVTCLSCGRPLEFGDTKVDSTGRSGRVEAVCRVGHRNVMRVELEVA